MKILTIVILVLVLSDPVFAYRDKDGFYLRDNPMEDSYSHESPRDNLRYNPMQNEWTYEDPESTLKYNPMQDRWEYAE